MKKEIISKYKELSGKKDALPHRDICSEAVEIKPAELGKGEPTNGRGSSNSFRSPPRSDCNNQLFPAMIDDNYQAGAMHRLDPNIS